MNESGIISKVILLGQYSFFLELFFALLILLHRSKKRKYFWLRAIGCIAVSFPTFYMPMLYLGSFNYTFLIIMILVFLSSIFLYQESIPTLFFSTIASWGIQHCYWNLMSVVFDLVPGVSSWSKLQIQLVDIPGIIVIYLFFFLAFHKLKIRPEFRKEQVFSFAFATIMMLATMSLSQSIKQWNIAIRFYSFFLALLSLIIMIGYPYLVNLIVKERNLANEKKNLENMLALQAEQQQLSKQTTDVLNMKFHDMKNQLLSMKSMDEKNRIKTADEIEKSIDIYSDIARTGNEAMDIVITQKSLLCSSKKIRFTYILDGSACRFMSSTDITSLYGNIIDNAIEACEKEEGDFRLIKLKTCRQDGFLLIQEENYCHNPVSFGKDGLPLSNKADRNLHGFGTKSIRYIVEKYSGQLNLRQEDGVFYLSLLIPVPEEENTPYSTDCVSKHDR